FALPKLLKKWEHSMAEHSNHVCHNTQGKPVAATQKKLEEYLKPVFKLLRKGAL
ncbi:hypothetical protein PPACK8108_LOCUS1913, partial [Phakopsora pachyrhizi]